MPRSTYRKRWLLSCDFFTELHCSLSLWDQVIYNFAFCNVSKVIVSLMTRYPWQIWAKLVIVAAEKFGEAIVMFSVLRLWIFLSLVFYYSTHQISTLFDVTRKPLCIKIGHKIALISGHNEPVLDCKMRSFPHNLICRRLLLARWEPLTDLSIHTATVQHQSHIR
jgi:hypothetical protein